MKILSSELLPQETRVVLPEHFRERLLSDKDRIRRQLNVHMNTVNAWIRGEYNPSIKQLNGLGINIKDIWANIKSIHLEGGKRHFLIQKYLDIHKLSWLLGIQDGDRAGNPNESIGITNQDINLVRNFIDTTSNLFNINRNEFIVEVYYDKNNGDLSLSKELGIKETQIKIYKYKGPFKQTKPVIRAILFSKIVSEVMNNFKKLMIVDIENGNTTHYSWYVRGLADSDGGFVRRNICISQTFNKENLQKLYLIEKIFKGIGIQHGGISGPDVKNMLRLYIYSDKLNLRNYHDFIGFDSKPKLEKLKSIIS